MAAKKGSKKGSRTTESTADRRKGRGPAWTFPKKTLEDSIGVAQAIEEKNAGKPMRAQDLARAVGFNQANDWRFLELLRSAQQYGIVQGSGASATVQLEKIGQDIVAPSASQQRQDALLKAFRNVDEFKRVEDYYSGKRIPEGEYFENTLARDFNIPRDRIDIFIAVFTSNLKYLNLFHARRGTSAEPMEGASSGEVQPVVETTVGRIREFLDTCFVMMPFGNYFDSYYRDIYSPAIKDAGFEPSRADELFSTGSVVDQIWEQIQKSKVLLADLSDKNANVFYELGLAHSAGKPVILAAAALDDVPFDLRHLRVIIYDVRRPGWDDSLRSSVSEYLKSAKADPNKSIPTPFRKNMHAE